jgi:hypothetical protein
MTEHPMRCFLLAHLGSHDRSDQIEDHLAELGELAKAVS